MIKTTTVNNRTLLYSLNDKNSVHHTIPLKSKNEILEGRSSLQVRYIRRLRLRAVNMLGGQCKSCGNPDLRVLQIDHIKGKGERERRKKNYYQFLKKVINDKGNKYQILCANCNTIKKFENFEM